MLFRRYCPAPCRALAAQLWAVALIRRLSALDKPLRPMYDDYCKLRGGVRFPTGGTVREPLWRPIR